MPNFQRKISEYFSVKAPNGKGDLIRSASTVCLAGPTRLFISEGSQ
jgi:hypothetical protein